ncbi:MAG TPA: TonB-dependent receptor [Acetobacteraceae bacterium]|nr:TonB-dependent receptor [Acetobacteraceae bacterium]
MRVLNLKHSLLVGSSLAAFAVLAGPALAQQADQSAETVIVTGTRVQGMTAADSAAPITVLGTDALTHGSGSADLRQALGQTIPSFTAQQFGSDTANLTLSAALDGLSPNDTLVLINGKRRHYSGNLHVDGGNFASGSSAPDISLIPEAAIDHVEVLQDGAAAQYGTDAIAGVINIILKNKSSGGSLSATAGDYYDRGGVPTDNGLKAGGTKYDVSYNMGLPLFDKGFVNFTIDKQYGNFTQTGGADYRVAGPTGTGLATGPVGGVPLSVLQAMPGYPRINPINGNPEYQLTMAEVNSEYDFSDNFGIYAFGTIGHKFGKSYENNRMPSQIEATPGSSQPCSAANPDGYDQGSSTANGLTPSCAGPFALTTANGASAVPGTAGAGLNPGTGQVISSGNSGTYTAPGELIMYPEGFRPMEVLKEDDYQYNVGEKFNLFGWAVDADVGYGKDIDNIYTWNSGNRSLFIDTHTSPSNFYDGSFTASQLTGTIDATHAFNVGLASPLTVAVGVEARQDEFAIGAGDADSYYKEGAQSFPGFTPSAAGDHSRKNYAGYIDLAVAPIEALQIDVAGRAEHYTDFGDTQIGKITARYDFNPQWAIRGTISTGFRAPTLAEEFYTAVNVSPNSATVQLPADSAAAKVLGLPNLVPEVSTSYSAGIVAHPLDDLSVTVDAYSIAIGDRITSSSTVNSAGGVINTPLVNQAIAADGVVLDPTATQNGATAFLNGISTLTQGVDVTANYPTDLGVYGLVDWTFAANYNQTAVSRVAPTPAVLTASNAGATFFYPDTLYDFTHSAPTTKIGLTANWSLDEFGITLRETLYGPMHGYTSPEGCTTLDTCVYIPQAAVGLTDLEVRYNVTDQLQFALGANNLFNIRPDAMPYDQNAYGAGVGAPADGGNVIGNPIPGAFDPNGGYYYGRITFNF